MDNFYSRRLTPRIREALSDSPVVLLNGARQTGKTTLALDLQESSGGTPENYVSLDDAGMLGAARSDAPGFLAGLEAARGGGSTPIVIDEVQHAPELFPAIKLSIDRARRQKQNTAGKFLLTGSANVMLLPKIAESLAGRMEVLTLWPLAQCEIEKAAGDFVDILFASRFDFALKPKTAPENLSTRLLRGGYPEALQRASEARRKAWFDSYINAILLRDVREISNIEGLTAMPRLLQFLATRAGGLLNLSDVSRATTLPYATLHRYMSLLEATFLIHLIPAWSSRLGTRLVKAPKLMLNDTGLIASLLSINAERLHNESLLRGALWENFVATEVLKLASWSQTQPRVHHFRTQSGQEVDLVLENAGGQIVGIETKSAATVGSDDFKGLRHLAEVAGKNFVCGCVLYQGTEIIPFASNLYALPVQALWS
jgi:predicted AAA+ superfamily ATPase